MKRHDLRWMRLDNAGKIYPASKKRRWINKFRLSADLIEPVDVNVLNTAIQSTVKRFPSISVRLKRGVFWYYLEEVGAPPSAYPDFSCPLVSMSFPDIKKCAFRVLYYENRIAVELFHALTDGNGGLIFLKTLVAEYLSLKYGIDIPKEKGVLDSSEDPSESELEDSFLKNAGPVSGSRRESDAYHLTGSPEPDGFINITTGVIDTVELLKFSKFYGVSLTVFLVSVLIFAVSKIQNRKIPERRKHRPVKILVPVNLRKMFNSTSLRNFVLYVTPGIDTRMGDYTFEEILKIVYHQMGMELTDKQMLTRITANVKAEKYFILKIMPLFLKNAAMKIGYSLYGEKKSCLSFSNLGVINVPDIMYEYIDRFDFILGPQSTSPSNCGLLSFKDKTYISFTRNIKEPELERNFFTALRNFGIPVKIQSNQKH